MNRIEIRPIMQGEGRGDYQVVEVGGCSCGHGRSDHSSNDYDLTCELGECLFCSCATFRAIAA